MKPISPEMSAQIQRAEQVAKFGRKQIAQWDKEHPAYREAMWKWRQDFDNQPCASVKRGNTQYLIDTTTREILDRGQPPKPHPNWQELRVYEKVLADISQARPLTGEGYRILLYLFSQVDATNHIPGPTAVARQLNLQQAHVSRAYRQMVHDGYLVKDDDGYRIHPFICWRGSDGNRNDAISELLNETIRQSETITEAYVHRHNTYIF